MNVFPHIRRAFATTLLVAIALTTVGPAGTFFFCGHMQEMMRSTCCGHDDEAPMRIDAGDCCEVFSVDRVMMQSDTQQRSFLPALPPMASLLTLPDPVVVDGLVASFDAFSVDSTGPLILRVTQALLI